MSDLSDVLETLHTRRAGHVAALTEHQTAVELIDKAIESLTMLEKATATSNGTDRTERGRRFVENVISGKSVLRQAVDLLNEGPRAWTADEIIDEYASRGAPLSVKDPRNAMFSALSRASGKGEIVRVGHGKYVAPQFADRPEFDDRGAARPVQVEERLPEATAFPSYESPGITFQEADAQ